jgi:methionyl-tRNA synthetase
MNPTIPKVAFVSTAIPYVNAAPHLGYAFEAVIADSIARYRRGAGWSVHHQAGTDDNSLKNAYAAAAAGLTTRELVDQNVARFHALGELLGLSWDAFVRTSSDPQHQRNVVEIWERCRKRGDIYTATYTGLYCVGCETVSTRRASSTMVVVQSTVSRPNALASGTTSFAYRAIKQSS